MLRTTLRLALCDGRVRALFSQLLVGSFWMRCAVLDACVVELAAMVDPLRLVRRPLWTRLALRSSRTFCTN